MVDKMMFCLALDWITIVRLFQLQSWRGRVAALLGYSALNWASNAQGERVAYRSCLGVQRPVSCQAMPTVALQAHFDGKHIVLDEPYDLPANASLMVTLLPSSPDEDTEEAWLKAAASSDAFAFLADPAEDIYSPTDGEPFSNAS